MIYNILNLNKNNSNNNKYQNQTLVGVVVIDVELAREDYDSISSNCDWEGVGTI